MFAIKAENRTLFKKKARDLRKTGKIPAIVYGKGIDAESLSIPFTDFMRVWRRAGESSLVEIAVGEKKHNVLITEVQLDPIKNTPIHVDFHAVRMDEKITTSVPIAFEGESPAVKQEGGVLVKVLHELEVESLPADLPQEITIDISALVKFEDRITVADIKLKEGIVIQADPEDVVVLVTAPREEKEEEAKSIEEIEVTTEKKEGGLSDADAAEGKQEGQKTTGKEQ
ncbi:MAG: 50S ribosomal protein L25/general stress protein Ctc [Candidatus Niyogibacteria bacterium]|nr:50S ribosomal protein L25/general stress protein Ctc [Candidatus Niyogibacteria bacterium]